MPTTMAVRISTCGSGRERAWFAALLSTAAAFIATLYTFHLGDGQSALGGWQPPVGINLSLDAANRPILLLIMLAGLVSLLMASPNTIYRLSRDADHRPHARKVLSIPSYPRPASISPDETRMVSYRQQAYGKSYVYAVHQISDDGTRVSSTDGDQDVLGSYVVWLPHGLGAPSGVVVVPPPSGWDAASP